MEQLLRRLLQSLGGAGHYGDGFIIPAYKHIAVFSFFSFSSFICFAFFDKKEEETKTIMRV